MPGPLTTIATFRDLPEALLAKGKLESAGIQCFLADDNLVRMDWFWANALGGVKLRVATPEAERAQELLEQDIPLRFAPEETGEEYLQPMCPHCYSLDVRYDSPYHGLQLTVLAVLPVPVPAGKQRWICESCGAEWEEKEESPLA